MSNVQLYSIIPHLIKEMSICHEDTEGKKVITLEIKDKGKRIYPSSRSMSVGLDLATALLK